MKLKRLDRAALLLMAALIVLALILLFVCAIAPDMAESMGAAFHAGMLNYPLLRVLVILVCLALAALVCGGVWTLLRGREKKDDVPPVSINEAEGGSVQISQTALEALVRRSAGPIDGVNRFDVKLEKRENALDVTLEMSVRQGVKIPELAQTARQNVREALEGMTGVKVENVTLLVSDISTDAPASSDEKQ